ncbi:MAG: excinuclease ABC subunit UvrC [Patescibacteria group bacterium]|jgi:excinuclease ABC subunit C
MNQLAEKIAQAPKTPGCYLFKNQAGSIIYVGKAKDLKKRVSWYFQKENQDSKTKNLIREIADVNFFITDNEVEALLLESELIKKNQPKYNIQLKSGIRYAYIRVTNDKFSKLESTRQIKKGDQIFGPYTSGEARQRVIRLANSIFKLRICKKLPKRACLLWHINLCSAPCIGKISEADYRKNIGQAVMLLKGQTKELIKKLTEEMQVFSTKLNYELAKLRRDQIFALQNISERQKIQLIKKYNQDVINYLPTPNKLIVQLFNINKGIVSGRREFKVATMFNRPAAENISEFIRQYYYTEDIPAEIIIPEKLSGQALLEKYLSEISKNKITITIPQKGDKLKLLELVKKNIAVGLKTGESGLLELQNKLSLPTLPRTIECFDVSNLGSTDVVGSMVQFFDGLPNKDNYRRFKIKTFSGQSDFEAMKEIIYRRYYRITKEKSVLPDLIMVDGGRPQLSAALVSLRELGLQIPVIGLAKKEEEIYTMNNQYPLRWPKNSASLKLLQRIRDQAHRFAIGYQRLLRQKRNFH